MKCKLCKNSVKPGNNSMIEENFAVHLECGMGEGKTPGSGKHPGARNSKRNKKNPFVAQKGTRGWRDIK